MADANFPNGLIIKKPHQNAPGFVKCRLSFNVNDFIQCLQQNTINGWVNMDMKVSQKGSLYVEIDSWQPNQQQAPPQQPQQNQYQQQQQPQYQQPQQNSQFTPDNNLAQPQQNQTPQQQAPQQQQQPQGNQAPQGGGYGSDPVLDENIPF